STHYMDEAERCHEIAYIADGRLLTQGTIADIIAHSGLSTYVVTGPALDELAARLRATPGVDMVAPFGMDLHVAGRDAERLAEIARRFGSGSAQKWVQDQPTLEDIFIDLMTR